MMATTTSRPGFFNIGLNFGKKHLKQYLSHEIEQLKYFLQIETIYIQPAIRNMQAMLLFYMHPDKTKACTKLEELITDYPDNLNALANLIHIYKIQNKNSNNYEKQFDSYKDNPLLQAKSILGQANALTYDMINNHPVLAEVHLKNIWRLIYMGNQRSQDVNETNKLVVEAYKKSKTISQTYYRETIDTKQIAVEKFEKGIRMLENLECSQEEILVWKHNLAIVRGRLNSWKQQEHDYNFYCQDDWKKALEDHLDVIEYLPQTTEPLKRYVALSCMSFVQLCSSRPRPRNPLQGRLGRQDEPFLVQKAKSLCPNDPTVLVKCARYECSNQNYLKAIKLSGKAISQTSTTKWSAYVWRCNAYHWYSKTQHDSNQIKKYLKLAYKDSKVSLRYKKGCKSLTKMAEICFSRAMPDLESGIKFHCQDIDFIYKAVEHLTKAWEEKSKTQDVWIFTQFGKYYPFIGEYRKAVEFLKASLELSQEFNYSGLFLDLCKCLVALYESVKDENLLIELRCMLKKANRTCQETLVTDAMQTIYNNSREMLTDLVQNMINWDVRDSEMLIKEALRMYDSPNSNLEEFKEEFKTKLQNSNEQGNCINGPREIKKSQSTENVQYDFFVSHSQKEKDWVNCMLRPQIEDYDEDIQFKGCIPSRDFVAGEKVIDSLFEGISHSCKLLIVLTPEYLKTDWRIYSSDSKIRSVIERKIQEQNIILLILEECSIPKELADFTPILFTKFSDWDLLRMDLSINTNI